MARVGAGGHGRSRHFCLLLKRGCKHRVCLQNRAEPANHVAADMRTMPAMEGRCVCPAMWQMRVRVSESGPLPDAFRSGTAGSVARFRWIKQ